MDVVKALTRARDAYERREWLTAYETLSNLDNTALTALDFITLGHTAELLGHTNDAIQALQRAHHSALDADEPLIAVRAAARLAMLLGRNGETAVASGWLAAGERMLDEIDGEAVERGYLLLGRMLERLSAGDFETAAPLPEQIIDFGRSHSDANLLAMGLNLQGWVLNLSGQVTAGVRFLDEAMTGVVAGEVDDPLIAGGVYCSMIEACQEISDWGRAGQWTRALITWCEEQVGMEVFSDRCGVHKAQLMRFNGAFAAALAELDRTLEHFIIEGNHALMSVAYTERGDVLRILGDFDGAEEAYAKALLHGSEAQLGRALLSLSRGNIDQAEASISRMLEVTQGAVFRHRLIPGCVEVFLAAGRVAEAAVLGDELAAIAEDFGSLAMQAAAGTVAAQVHVARGEAHSALAAAQLAVHHWLQLDAAYEAARSRVVLGQALQLLGDKDGAALQLTTALAAFESQGARIDAQNVTQRLARPDRPGGLTPREIEVLSLVAAGNSNAQIATNLHLSTKTVARHLSNIYTKLGVGSRTQAAAVAHQQGLV